MIRKALLSLKQSGAVLSITFVTDREMAGLNQKYLKKKGPTDVLSFPMNSKGLLGDMVISLDTAGRQAKELKMSVRDHCVQLIVHGLFHLLGFDHQTERDWRRMKKKEQQLLSTLILKP